MAKGMRRAVTGGGWRQTVPLVPLALFAAAFGIQASADDPAVANAALGDPGSTGSGVVVPGEPIDAPANIPVPGVVANGVPRDAHDTQVVSGLSRNGIPQAALAAYSRAQQVLSKADPGCHLPWTVVAAIGRVESNHGRHGGNVLNADGAAVPGIFGPRLDGTGTARIADSDDGRLDGDRTFDRAVGPMQFIPGTWRAMGVDGDGDGRKNPQDVDDAAMSTAVYLCAGDTDLTDPSDLNDAVLRYNHSQAYVDLVTRIARAYAGGSWTAVDNGKPENADHGIEHGKDDADRADGIAPTDPLGYPTQLPPARVSTGPSSSTDPTRAPGSNRPTTRPTTRPGTTRPGTTRPTGDPTTSRPPTTRPPTSEPTTSRPPTSKPPVADPVVAVQTTVGRITATAGTTLAELRSAVGYCTDRLADNRIPATRARLQDCTTAYLTGGPNAVDGVIRNLLSLLGLLGVLPLS